MNLSQEEARVARIQKYKDERRKQLTARTATLFSSNVTERRPRKASNRTLSEDTGGHLKSSSELNLNTASTSVPIRTTRASRLRAAAANQESPSTPKKSIRSSSVTSLIDDVKVKTPRTSRIIDRDKNKTDKRRQSREEKENKKSVGSTGPANKDNGATKTKQKHSINKSNLEKDKSKIIVTSPKRKIQTPADFDANNLVNVDNKNSSNQILDDLKNDSDKDLRVNGEEILEELLADENPVEKDQIEDLFNDLITDKCDVQNGILLNLNDEVLDENVVINNSINSGLKINSQTDFKVPTDVKGYKEVKCVGLDKSVVCVKEEPVGLLGVACVRKVERFSELLSNLCSPREADLLFEDLLAENGIDNSVNERLSTPSCEPPCRRAQPSPRASSGATKQTPLPTSSADISGTTKHKTKSNTDTSRNKTETPQSSSKISPKSTYNFSIKSINKSLSTTPSKTQERRRSSEGVKPSQIPLSKKSPDKQTRHLTSPLKQETTTKSDLKIKPETSKDRVRKSTDKSKSDSESSRIDRRNRAQKEIGSVFEKYHNSKKRLTSLENNSSKHTNDVKKTSPRSSLNEKSLSVSKAERDILVDCNKPGKMSTLHESVRPHTNRCRLSQEMDSLAALTKQTLDRVNKLSSNLASNKLNLDTSEPQFDAMFATTSEQNGSYSQASSCGINDEKPFHSRGVSERLKDIDSAAQRLIDFEKQSAMFSDLSNDASSQNRPFDGALASCSLTPVSILKRKSIIDDNSISNTSSQAIASPPVTFSPNVIEPSNARSDNRQRQGILKKRRSLDESHVARIRSCSPEVSFADDGSPDTSKPILKNRRSSLEDVVRNRSPDGHIHGILKRKMSKEDDHIYDDLSHSSPEPHGILKRKSNSSSSSSTASSHVSIAQAVLLAAAGGAEIVDEDKDTVRPILKKKSFSEERPCIDIVTSDTPKPILKKKSLEHDEQDFQDLPKKPILKLSKKLIGDEGNASSFDLSEDDRSSRRPSLLRSKTSDHSGSECETTVKPILKQRGSSLTRERSQSPRPRLSFCADSDVNISVANFSSDTNDLSAAGPSGLLTHPSDPEESANNCNYPSAVLRRRNLRPKTSPRSKSLACDVNDELLSILNNRRIKVEENCDNELAEDWETKNNVATGDEERPEGFPSIASRIKSMEQALTSPKDQPSTSKSRTRDRDRYKTQPITVEEMRSITSSLEPGQASFQAFGPIGSSFPNRPAESRAAPSGLFYDATNLERDLFRDFKALDSPPFGTSSLATRHSPPVNGLLDDVIAKDDSFGEATFLDFESGRLGTLRRKSTLDDIEREVDKVRVALDEDCRALEEDERQGEGDNWSLNVSCDSGVYNRASSRDSGPHSGEELGLIESQQIKENQATNSSSNDWSSSSVEQGIFTMERQRKSTEVEDMRNPDDHSDDDDDNGHCGFNLGLVKSNSVVARASMWQQLQDQAKGTPKPLVRHNRSSIRDSISMADRFKTQPINFNPVSPPSRSSIENAEVETPLNSLSQSKSTANVLDRDEDAKLDEDDPAKLSLMEKMRMFNSKLTHKPPPAGLPRPKEERTRASRLRTMPVLASQVQEAIDNNERLTKSFTHEEVPRNPNFQMKMELFRSASAKNTSLEYIMRQNSKFRSLDLDDETPSETSHRMITPEVRGILKSGSTTVPSKPRTLTKGESSEGLKDEGIDSSSDDESSASSVSSSEKTCSSSDSSEEIHDPKPRRFQPRKNKLQPSKTESDVAKVLKTQDLFPKKIQLPGANELKERFAQAKNPEVKIPLLGKLHRKPSEEAKVDSADENNPRYKRFVKKLDEPIQLGKLRRPPEKLIPLESKPPMLRISALNQEAKNKFFGIEPKKEKTIDELAAAVRKYIPPQVSKSMSTCVMELGGSGSDGESSGGREVRQINNRVRHRAIGGGGIQRSATQAEMPHRGGTIAERLAALQAAGANDWRARVCRLSPDREDNKAIERAKNRINESLNSGVEDKKKPQIEENELSSNILADRRTKLETASQGWRKRVPQSDANLFTVAGRLERDKGSVNTTPPLTPPPTVPTPASPGIPTPNKFRSRKQPSSPTNGFLSGPLRSASCAIVSAAASIDKPKVELARHDRESFKRSHSVSESISQLNETEEPNGAEKIGATVRVPRADDETFQAFFTPVLEKQEIAPAADFDVDLDAIDSGSRQLLANDWARRAKRERRHAASRNPLRALAARTDLREEYSPPPARGTEHFVRDRATANCGLAAEALAALASKEDFSNVALKSAAAASNTNTDSLMVLHVKGRRRVQTRLVEPVHSSVNRGDCYVLVTPDHVFLYLGFYANVIERNRSTDIALHIQNTKDLGCKNATGVITIDEHSKNYTNKHWNQFWSLLGVKDDIENYKPIETGHPDEDEIFESCIIQTNMCYEVLDDELLPIKEYWGQMPKIAMLNQSKTIVFDFGSEMYTWYGKNVPLESRRRAAQLAQELFDEGYNYEDCHINPVNAAAYQGARDENGAVNKSSKTRPKWAILSKVTQHMESILFKEKFLDWPDYTRVIKVKPQENKTNSTEITACDAEEMYANDYQDPDLILEGSHVGRGTHYYDKESMRHFDIKTKSVCKWVIQESDYQKVENESEISEFFSGDSYIIRWEYQITATGRELNGKPSKHNLTGRDRCAYFCWQGKDASSNEKGTAALLTVELDKEKGPQIRVTQGNEPPAFLNLFQGKLIIHQGKKDTDKSRYKLFVTRGNLSNEAYLLQVPCSVRQLRSRGSLLLVDTEKGCLYIWHGARSLKHTKNIATELANKLIARESNYLFGSNMANVKIKEVKEGDEPKEVLEALGGANKQYYNSILGSSKDAPEPYHPGTPRLFHFTDLAGQFEANEVLSPLRHESLDTPFPFEQKELYSASQPALFLLDAGAAVWVWQGWWPRDDYGGNDPTERNGVGAFAARWQAMRAAALETALAYSKVKRGQRLLRGGQGEKGEQAERGNPPDVQIVTAGLEPKDFTELFDTWTENDDAAQANIEHGYKAGEILNGACELSRLTCCDAILPLAALQRRPLPDHVDPQHLERHLSAQDFQEAFGMTKEEFSGLPAWKQTNMKKEVGLF